MRHRVDVRVDPRADILQIDHEHVEAFQHLCRGLARLTVKRVQRDAPPVVAAVFRLDHVLLDVGAESVLGAENRREPRARMRREGVGDMRELMIDRRRVADDADALAIEDTGSEQALRSERDEHRGRLFHRLRSPVPGRSVHAFASTVHS
jgi:hypothetical protein